MRRSLALVLTLVAWLMATGSHWDLVQTFGWGRMIATYSQSMPLTQAVRLTFTADNFCGVCDLVNDAKQASDGGVGAGAKAGIEKILLAAPAVPVLVLVTPDVPTWSPRDHRLPASWASVPPVPPPRVCAA